MTIPVLIIGGKSTIGSALALQLQSNKLPYYTTSRSRDKNDSSIYLDISQNIADFTPPFSQGIAFLCAGISSLRDCEQDRQHAEYVNVQQLTALAKKLALGRTKLVYFSSNLVFDGKILLPSVGQNTAPQTQYGRHKAAFEQILLSIQPEALVLRLTKILPPAFALFDQWRHAWTQGKAVQAFTDMRVAPVTLEQLVHVIFTLVKRQCHGIWHISPHEEWTYAEVATYLAKAWTYDTRLVQTCSALEHMPAFFCPQHVALESSATWTKCGLPIPTVVDALQQYTQRNALPS